MQQPDFVYVTYIRTTAEKVWHALLDHEATRQYWYNHRNANTDDWRVGSEWRHEDYDNAQKIDVRGTVIENTPPHRLVVSWASPARFGDPTATSQVTFDIVEEKGVVKLTVTHAQLQDDEGMARAISGGWPKVLAGLKTFLETGEALPRV